MLANKFFPLCEFSPNNKGRSAGLVILLHFAVTNSSFSSINPEQEIVDLIHLKQEAIPPGGGR